MESSDILRIIVFVMVGVIVATITLAAVSYGAFRMRERRRPHKIDSGADGLLFFERVEIVPPRPEPPAGEAE